MLKDPKFRITYLDVRVLDRKIRLADLNVVVKDPKLR